MSSLAIYKRHAAHRGDCACTALHCHIRKLQAADDEPRQIHTHKQTNNSGVKLYYRSNNYCSRLKALVAKGQCWVQSSPSDQLPDILSVISLVASSHSHRARACAHTASPQKRSSHTDELSWRHTYVHDVIHSVSGIMHAYTAHFMVL